MISIHTPHAGSDDFRQRIINALNISIHTPHAGSDARYTLAVKRKYAFQSTLPMRGATLPLPIRGLHQ